MNHTIYFLGASGTGKTTLAKHVEEEYGVHRLGSASRAVFAESFADKFKDYEQLILNKGAYFDFQTQTCDRQINMELEAREKYGTFVTDRCFDHLVYAALYGSRCSVIAGSYMMCGYMDRMRQGSIDSANPIFFLCRPVLQILYSAIKDNDRNNFLDWNMMQKFDGACQFILESQGLKYTAVNYVEQRDRTRLVDSVLAAHGIRKKEKAK